MLKFPAKVSNKVILIAPVLLGIYLAIMYLLHGAILAFISYRLGISITNNYPFLTALVLYVATVPLAIVLNKLLLKQSQTHDEKLIAGLVSNFAFNFTVALLFGFISNGDLATSFIVLLVLSFFGFVLAALLTVLIDKIEVKFSDNKSSPI